MQSSRVARARGTAGGARVEDDPRRVSDGEHEPETAVQHDLVLRAHDVALVPLDFAHAEALLGLVDEALWAGLSSPLPRTATDMERLVLTAWETPGRYAFTVVDAATGEVRGSTSLHEVERLHRRAALGHTFYGRAWWGGTTNPATKLAVLGLAFETWSLHRVALRVDPRNVRSLAAVRRLGAVEEGVLRGHRATADGDQADSVSFSILEPEWPEVKARLCARLGVAPGGVTSQAPGVSSALSSVSALPAAPGVAAPQAVGTPPVLTAPPALSTTTALENPEVAVAPPGEGGLLVPS